MLLVNHRKFFYQRKDKDKNRNSQVFNGKIISPVVLRPQTICTWKMYFRCMKTINLLFFVKMLGEIERKNVPLPCILHKCAPVHEYVDSDKAVETADELSK